MKSRNPVTLNELTVLYVVHRTAARMALVIGNAHGLLKYIPLNYFLLL
jgi:hypothetical protein